MAIDVSPRFTLSLRGYDKVEVDEYLEELSARSGEFDAQLNAYEERARALEHQKQRMAARIAELEDAIRSESPHTVRALGERISLILGEAETGAEETLSQARSHADSLVADAEREAETLRRQASMYSAQAQETLAGAQRQAEELAERLEADAKARAAGIVADAEGRARRRHEQIESWAQEVIARTQADQARLTEEFAEVRRRHEAEVADLVVRRDEVVATLRSLTGALERAVNRAVAGVNDNAGHPGSVEPPYRPELPARSFGRPELVAQPVESGSTQAEADLAPPGLPVAG